jgi:hypothetical protein
MRTENAAHVYLRMGGVFFDFENSNQLLALDSILIP